MRTLVLLTCLLCLAGSPAVAQRLVLAVNIGWHVGLAVPTERLDPVELPEIADFPDARWIEFGWGDAAFYQDPNPGLGTALEAALVPTPAVLHLVAMPDHPARYLPKAEVVEIPLDDAQYRRLVAYVSRHMDRRGGQRAAAIGQGLYPVSRFYPAHGLFSLERTCNTWVAEALAEAGLPIDPAGVVRAGTLMARIRVAQGQPSPPSPEPSEPR